VGLMPTAYSNDWGNVVAQYGPYDEGTHSMSFGSSPSQQVKRKEKKRKDGNIKQQSFQCHFMESGLQWSMALKS